MIESSERRYDIDWWRVIAIFAVYLHHIGMPFNGDNFHIMNSESSKALDDIMVYFEQFRLPLLFFISGIGTVFAFSKRSVRSFVMERATRLLIPLCFGVIFIVPPQYYFEHINSFDQHNPVFPDLFLKFNVNHLWFIENLFFISILCIPIILFVKSQYFSLLHRIIINIMNYKFGFLVWVLIAMIIKVISKYYFPSDSKSLLNLSSTLFYGFFFVSGILISKSLPVWKILKVRSAFHFKLFILVSILFYIIYYFPSDIAAQHLDLSIRWSIWYAITSLLSCVFIITAIGFGQQIWTSSSRLLSKMNEAIYPFYILHQTIIVIFAYYIVQLNFSIPIKIGLLLITSFPVIILFYRFIIYPYDKIRFLFGMKKRSSSHPMN